MDLQELKQNILNKEIPSKLIIFTYSSENCMFLIEQYLDEICKATGRNINSISSLQEITKSSLALVFNFDSELNVLKTEEFNEFCTDYDIINNTVVICEKIDKKILPLVSEYIVKVPAVQEWQLLAYMKMYCSGLSENSYINLLYSANFNVYRIINELDKLLLFDEQDREQIICDCFEAKGSDLYYFGNYEITNAIKSFAKNDPAAYSTLIRYFKHKDSHPLKTPGKSINDELLDFVGLSIGGLNAKKTFYYGAIGEVVGKGGQYGLTRKAAILEFLTDIDLKIKSGDLDYSNDLLLDYVITKMLSLNKLLQNYK